MIVMVFCVAGIARADLTITTFNKITPDIASSSVTGAGTNHVIYGGGGWSTGLSQKWWDPVLGSDNDYSYTAGDKYGFAGGSFTLSADASVTMKVTAFSYSSNLSDTEIYLYKNAFDRSNPTTNKVGSWDGLAGGTVELNAGSTYWLIVTTDAPFIPSSGAATVTADITTAPVSAVPIPAAVWLFGSGLIGLAVRNSDCIESQQ
jgi:hypothetical protein